MKESLLFKTWISTCIFFPFVGGECPILVGELEKSEQNIKIKNVYKA